MSLYYPNVVYFRLVWDYVDKKNGLEAYSMGTLGAHRGFGVDVSETQILL